MHSVTAKSSRMQISTEQPASQPERRSPTDLRSRSRRLASCGCPVALAAAHTVCALDTGAPVPLLLLLRRRRLHRASRGKLRGRLLRQRRAPGGSVDGTRGVRRSGEAEGLVAVAAVERCRSSAWKASKADCDGAEAAVGRSAEKRPPRLAVIVCGGGGLAKAQIRRAHRRRTGPRLVSYTRAYRAPRFFHAVRIPGSVCDSSQGDERNDHSRGRLPARERRHDAIRKVGRVLVREAVSCLACGGDAAAQRVRSAVVCV